MPHDHTHLQTASSGVSGQAFTALKQRLGRQQQQQQQRERELAEGAWSQSHKHFQPTLYRKALRHCVCSLTSSPNTLATKSVSAMLISLVLVFH